MSAGSSAKRILVIGGGFAGMTAALALHNGGCKVELLEIDAGWRSYGAGISLHGAVMRVFERIGILDRFLEVGAVFDGVELRSPATDQILATLPTPPVGDGLPAAGGVMRSDLACILNEAVRRTGIALRLGQSFTAIDDDGAQVRVAFTDGSEAEYDLVIGADGLNSQVRAMILPDRGSPRYVGQGVWRAVMPTPPGIQRTVIWPGTTLKAGINRVSATGSYLFLTEDRPVNDFVPAATLQTQLAALLARFPSPILSAIREGLGPDSNIVYRPLEQFLMARPWHCGRVVLIGDAVHATTPHLAAGACIAMEDAIVLADEIGANVSLAAALDTFEQRRWERCRMVVENSGRLCEIEISGGDKQAHAVLMQESLMALAAPI